MKKKKTDPRSPFNPAHHHFRGLFQVSLIEMHQAHEGELFTLSSQGFNLRAICCYLGNVLRTLHGHICISSLTSPLFLAAARHWRLLWWCHAGFQNRSDCLSWIILPVLFSCPVCLCVCLSVKLLVLFCRDLFCRSYILSLIVQSSQSKVNFFLFFQIRFHLLKLILVEKPRRLPVKWRLSEQLNV